MLRTINEIDAMISVCTKPDGKGKLVRTAMAARYQQFRDLLTMDCGFDVEAFVRREVSRLQEKLLASEKQEEEFRSCCTGQKWEKEKLATLEKRTAELSDDFGLLQWFLNEE